MQEKAKIAAGLAKLMQCRSIGEALTVAQGLGVGIKAERLPLEHKPTVEQLDALATAAIRPGAEFYQLRTAVNGKQVQAFVVIEGDASHNGN